MFPQLFLPSHLFLLLHWKWWGRFKNHLWNPWRSLRLIFVFPFKKNILKEIWEACIFGKVNIKKKKKHLSTQLWKIALLCHYYFWQMDWVWFHRTRELTLSYFFSRLEESLTEWHTGYSSFAWSWLQNRNLKVLSRCKEKHK